MLQWSTTHKQGLAGSLFFFGSDVIDTSRCALAARECKNCWRRLVPGPVQSKGGDFSRVQPGQVLINERHYPGCQQFVGGSDKKVTQVLLGPFDWHRVHTGRAQHASQKIPSDFSILLSDPAEEKKKTSPKKREKSLSTTRPKHNEPGCWAKSSTPNKTKEEEATSWRQIV